jgi:hypothetical protein
VKSETWFKMARLEVRKNFFSISQKVPGSWNKNPPLLKQATTAKAFRNAYQKHRQTGASA